VTLQRCPAAAQARGTAEESGTGPLLQPHRPVW